MKQKAFFSYLYKMILVTGGTGLLGAHLLLHLLKKEPQVRAIYRDYRKKEVIEKFFQDQNSKKLYSKIEWIYADINDIPMLENAFLNIDYVYHCAGLISFEPRLEEQLRKINIEGTANIVNFCLAKNIKKLCYVSSIATLGDILTNETELDENSEWNPEKPNSDYAISKYGAEMEVWRGFQEGLKVVIVNPGVIFGKGFYETGSNTFFTKIKKGILFYTEGSTGYVSVNDVVKIMQILMESEINGERFVLISENKTYKEIFFKIATSLNVKKPKYQAKVWMTNLYYRYDWFIANYFGVYRNFTKFSAKAAHSIETISNKKIKTALQYNFQLIDDCIDEVALDFKSQNHTK